MASIRQHGNCWQARVRRKGHPEETKIFVTRQEAQKSARAVESVMDRGGVYQFHEYRADHSSGNHCAGRKSPYDLS
jgi:hypothetical protein